LLMQAAKQETRFAKEPRYWQYRAERAMARGELVAGKSALGRVAAMRANDPEVVEALLWSLLGEYYANDSALRTTDPSETDSAALIAAKAANSAAIYQLIERYSALATGDAVLAEAMAAAEQVLGRPAAAATWYLQTLPARKRDFVWLLTVADNLEWLGCTVTANQFRLRSLSQLQVQTPPFPAVLHPARLADYFYGRRYFARALEQVLPDDEVLRERIEQWRLHDGLDNARQFAINWQLKRLSLSDWEDLADEWQQQNAGAMANMIQALAIELQLTPAGPLSSAVLPLSLNDVAARSRRFGSARLTTPDASKAPDPSKELAVCRQTLDHFSALALSAPVVLPKPVLPTMVKP